MIPPRPTIGGLPPEIASELKALRDRAETQQGLIEVLSRASMSSKRGLATVVEAAVPLPARVAQMAVAETVSEPEGAPDPAFAAEWTPAMGEEPPPLVPHPGWSVYSLRAVINVAIGFSVCGLPPAEIERIVELVASVQRQSKSFAPLFITDDPDLTLFRRHGYAVEYVSRVITGRLSGPTLEAYLARRRELLTAKWNLVRIIDFGPVGFGGHEQVGGDGLKLALSALAE